MALRVVSRAIVDAHHLGFQGAEHQLARAPGVFKTAPRAAVVKAVVKEAIGPVVVQDFFG